VFTPTPSTKLYQNETEWSLISLAPTRNGSHSWRTCHTALSHPTTDGPLGDYQWAPRPDTWRQQNVRGSLRADSLRNPLKWWEVAAKQFCKRYLLIRNSICCIPTTDLSRLA